MIIQIENQIGTSTKKTLKTSCNFCCLSSTVLTVLTMLVVVTTMAPVGPRRLPVARRMKGWDKVGPDPIMGLWGPYEWPYKWITGDITLLIGIISSHL